MIRYLKARAIINHCMLGNQVQKEKHRSAHKLKNKRCILQGNLLHIQEKVSTKEQFPLPTLGPKLEAMREEVISGRGFYIIRCIWVTLFLNSVNSLSIYRGQSHAKGRRY